MAFLERAANPIIRQRAIGASLIDAGLAEPWEQRAMVDELLCHFDLAGPDEIYRGQVWYLDAHDHATKLGYDAGISTDHAAGVIAAASPQNEWDRNLDHARLILAGERPTYMTGLFYDRARRIVEGEHPTMVLGGRKVRSFWGNIARPWMPGPVTCDRHACAPLGIDVRLLERPGVYQALTAAYRTAGRERDLLPHQMQATVWVVWKRLKETK